MVSTIKSARCRKPQDYKLHV